jgi:hypothetical protein
MLNNGDFGTIPSMLKAKPLSVLKFLELSRTAKLDFSTSAHAAFVELFPTDPVTKTILGLCFSKTYLQRNLRNVQ